MYALALFCCAIGDWWQDSFLRAGAYSGASCDMIGVRQLVPQEGPLSSVKSAPAAWFLEESGSFGLFLLGNNRTPVRF